MKHLKKLSLALMLATLFSVSFTSCIDNEVSPVVEAIYAAQADLLAAQAGVQNAEAALRLAQAQAEQAQAAQTAAITAGITADNTYSAAQRVQYLLELVAETKLAVDKATKDLALAQVQFDIDMAAAIATMKAANVQIAVGYAYDYMYAMNIANSLKSQKAYEEGQLATLELYLKAGTLPTWPTYLADLNADIAVQNGKITAAQAAIVALNTAKANPTARETQLAGLKSQVAVLTARQIELVALKALATQEVTAAQAAITAASDFMTGTGTGSYTAVKALLTAAKGQYTTDTTAVRTQTNLVTSSTAAIANYAGTTTTLTNTKNAAVAVVGQTTTLPYTGLKGDILALQTTLGTYGTAPVWNGTARTATLPAVLSAQDKLWNADLALAKFDHDFALLTASYNAAAADLAVKQAAFDGGTWAADLAAANTALTNANIARTAAQTAYGIAKTAFEFAPAGSVVTDGPGLASDVDAWFNTIQFDLGNKGIEDLIATTYMEVTSWRETTFGSGLWVPATFAATKYTPSALATRVAAIKADVVNNTITADTQIYIWSDLAATMPLDDYAGNPIYANAHNLVPAIPARTQLASPDAAVFVEVESDDAAVPTVFTFNVATNKLGTENFSTRPFTILGATPNGSNWTSALLVSDLGAGYDSTWNGDVLVAQTKNTLTAQAVVWNATLEKMKKQYDFDNSSTALNDAKDVFAYQKSLFDTGLTIRAGLKTTQTAALAVVGQTSTLPYTGLLGDIDAKSKQLGNTAFGTPVFADVAKSLTTGTLGPDFYMVGLVKTFTAYAAKWNAELALVKHLNTTLATYQANLVAAQAALTAAQRNVAEDLIFIAKYTADLAALQARYDALIITPQYAALNVTLLAKQQALAVLVAEDAANVAMISTLNLVIVGLQGTVPDYTALIAAQNLIITNAKAAILVDQLAISQGNITLAGLQRDVQNKKDLIATLTQRIANALAVAAKYKALMDAALAA